MFRYQVRYRLLQAGEYGAPQSRRRVIIWGARRGVPLPQFPVPVYAFPQRPYNVSLPTGGKLCPPTRSKAPGEYHSFAPLRPRTVDDAIGDLVCRIYSTVFDISELTFSFRSFSRLLTGMSMTIHRKLRSSHTAFYRINPHEIIPENARDRKEANRRLEETGIPRFDAVSHPDKTFMELPGYPGGSPYPMPPQNRYQKWLREGMDEDDFVLGQYTTRFRPRIVEA